MHLLFHRLNQLRNVGDLVVQTFWVDVVAEQQTANAFLVHFAADRHVRQRFLDIDLEALLARLFGQAEELLSGKTTSAE